jgi:hypothetical protein
MPVQVFVDCGPPHQQAGSSIGHLCNTTIVQVPNPELGSLESRVGRFYLEELFNDSGVDLEETAYWFHTPPGADVFCTGTQGEALGHREARHAVAN